MSRVRDALKKANGVPAPTTHHDEPVRAGTALLEEVFRPEPTPAADSAGMDSPEGDATRRSRFRRVLRWRLVRRVLRLAGIRTSAPVPRCQGTTRSGIPCRGPAMKNGFCRLHGGSRHSPAAEKVRNLMDRVLPARESSSA